MKKIVISSAAGALFAVGMS
jgi:predicted porin